MKNLKKKSKKFKFYILVSYEEECVTVIIACWLNFRANKSYRKKKNHKALRRREGSESEKCIGKEIATAIYVPQSDAWFMFYVRSIYFSPFVSQSMCHAMMLYHSCILSFSAQFDFLCVPSETFFPSFKCRRSLSRISTIQWWFWWCSAQMLPFIESLKDFISQLCQY